MAENPKALLQNAARLSERYRGESGKGRVLTNGRRDIIAYSAVRMPATFGAAARALELTLAQYEGDISCVLDVGAGTGAATHAASLLTQAEKFTCLEREQDMLEVGKLLCESRGLAAEWRRCDVNMGFPEHADLVLSSYCLNEMSASNRKAAVERLWSAADKLLLIVEPGTPEGFLQLREARKQLISLGAKICAPCPDVGICPLEEGDWCHFTARIARTKLHKQLKGGDAPYEDEKFCFLAAAKSGAVPCTARVLRHPQIDSGRITLRLCTGSGISDRLITKKSPQFKAARKAVGGDVFPAE
ncbi:MAG: small ribosomal subunit Rsm22 family protein [Oscillospiraceae bacterium]